MKRKVHKGEIYDKERTKGKLIAAVGKILIKEGFQNIKINKIASVSGVSKKMIYDYFGGLDELIKAYLTRIDFWKIEEQKINGGESLLQEINEDFIGKLLKDDFEYFFKSTEMQKIVLWGISEKNNTIRTLSDEREELGERIFEKAEEYFNSSHVDFRATIAILISSIYYTVLHVKTNGSKMCGIDMSTETGKERMLKALDRLLSLTYKYSDLNL